MHVETNGTMRALAGGAVGASVVTALHESVRRLRPDAPRMDVLGMRAISAVMRSGGMKPPAADRLHTITMIGDLLGNGLYYSLVGTKGDDRVWLRGAVLGLAAGIGGVVLPPLMGLGSRPSGRTTQTMIMTVAWYLAGGFAAAATARMLARAQERFAVERTGEAAPKGWRLEDM